MRELKANELHEVSGAGYIADAGTALGQGIGRILEAAGVKGGLEAATAMGTGIGQVVEAGVGIIQDFFNSIFGKKS